MWPSLWLYCEYNSTMDIVVYYTPKAICNYAPSNPTRPMIKAAIENERSPCRIPKPCDSLKDPFREPYST